VETADGRLQVVPAQVIATRGRTIEARIEGPLTLSSGQACIVADRYASYEEIRGVISRGNVRIGEGGASLVSEKLSSFSFAGTLNGPPRAPGSLAAKP
jgi:hypothetical protein